MGSSSQQERRGPTSTNSVDYLLSWYFDSLWEWDTRGSGGFYTEWKGHEDPLTYCLYRDLREICENVFVNRLYRNKMKAKQYFMEEGFIVFLPTMLAMGARMVADQDLELSSGRRYLKALFTGLSLEPNFTMVYLSRQYHQYDPSMNKIIIEFKQRYSGNDPRGMTLEQISQAAQEMLRRLEGS